MPIVSNASPDEKSSPFFKANERLCHDWEKFILKKEGQINGRFNAWSFSVKAKVTTRQKWLVSVKKATYSNGVLIFSSKYQNLQEILEFQTRISNTDCGDFRLGQSRWKTRKTDHPLFDQIAQLVKSEYQDKSLTSAIFKKGLLTLTFQHKNDDFELAERVLDFALLT